MKMQRALQSLGMLFVLLLLVGPVVAKPLAPEAVFGGWQTETVDSTGNVGLYSSLDMDSAGYAHVAYYDTLNGDLQYAYQDATGWYTATVDSTGDVGAHCSLKVDAQDYSHISYYNATGGDLKYAYQDGTGWHVETVDPTNQIGRFTSLALDSAGQPHVSYQSDTGYVVKYAYKDGAGWHYESPPSVGQVFNTAIALNGSDEPRIAYIDGMSYDLYYGYKDGTGWHFAVAYNSPAGLQGTALAVDASGVAYLAYGSPNAGSVFFSYGGPGGWTQETVQSSAGSTDYFSLAQAGGTIHLSFWSAPLAALRYGERTASGWRLFTVDTGGVGQYSSIALGTTGRPHISYWDATGNNLKHAWVDAPWYTETVDYGVGNYVSLHFDSYSRPRVCFYDADQQDLVYGYRDASGWHTEAVDTAWDVGQYCSLVLDGQDYPHISYYYATEGDLRYAYKDGSGWHIENVDAAPYPVAGKWTSIALDAQGYPHISYFHESWEQLRHAYKDGTGWHTEGVDISQAGRYTSLVMDPTGTYPRISYQKFSGTAALYYAYKDGAGWHTMTAYADPDDVQTGYYTSLALDANGFPNISFADGTGHLHYTYRDGAGTWHPSVGDVPSAGAVGLWSTLVLDADGPHIVELDATADQLRYAYQSGTSWYTLPLAAVGADGGYCSLAADSLDHFGVAYYNASGPQQVEYTYNNCLSVAVAPSPPACVGTVVAFDNTSFGVLPVDWGWDFGDGITSSLAYPTHTYALHGAYPVTLSAENSCGEGSISFTQAISSTPVAGFTYAPQPVCSGELMQFHNTSVGSATLAYAWTFGDGGLSTEISPTHIYVDPGNYEVFLVATNGCGQDTEHQTVPAHAGPDVAVAWSPPVPEVHQPVLFTGQATSTLPVVYTWDFGDGTSAGGMTATHAYATAGSYTVTLTGTTACGTDVATAVVTVVCYPAEAAGLNWNPVTPTIGITTTFTAQISGTLPLTCTWNFGDGNTAGPAACAGLVPISHTYVATGTFTVALTAFNDCGTATVSGTLTVVALPQAAFSSNTPLCQGQTAVFTNTSSGAEPLSFQWAFGDGYTSTLRSPTHYYAESGVFTVALTASNPYGVDTATNPVQVRDGVSTADFTWEPAYPAPGEPVTLTATTNGTAPVVYEWSLGDGVTATGQVVVHAYVTTDTYTVTLQAYNDCGGEIVTHPVAVSFCTAPAGLTAAFTPTVPAPGAVVAFTATLAAGSPPLTIAWDFGDGSAWGYGSTVTHTYATQGVYTASVASWNSCGYVGPVNQRVEVRFPARPGVIYLPLVYKNYCADGFEPDDTAAQARGLALGVPQTHNFAPAGDEDWTRLTLAAGTTYRFWTANLEGGADTRLYLYVQGQYGSPAAQNDDWASGNCGGTPADPKQSCFQYTASTSGVYELKVDQYPGGAQWGCAVQYDLEATQQ